MNVRIDKETGEPILSPKLSPDQLHAMADDPGWRPWIRLIASHPNAWPELVDWCRRAQELGFDTAGAAPRPPEPLRGRGRVAIPTAPLPPEDDTEPARSPDTMPAVDEPPASEPSPTGDPTLDTGADGAGDDPDAARDAIARADDDYALLDEFADRTPTSTSDSDDGEDTADLDIRVRRGLPRTVVAVGVVILMVGLMAAGGVVFLHHRGEAARADAMDECSRAHADAVRRRDALDDTLEEARRLLDATDPDQVDDTAVLDDLADLASRNVADPPACSTDDPDASAMTGTGKGYDSAADELEDAMDKVRESILDRTVADARRLYDESAGKVADEKTRTALDQAIDGRDAETIRDAMDKVRESVKAKTEADRAKAKAEAERTQQERREQAPASPPATGGSDAYVAPAPSTPVPSTPAPAPQQQAPAPAAPSVPATPSKPSGSDGAVVG